MIRRRTTLLLSLLAVSLVSCERFDEFSDALSDSIGQQPAQADEAPIGLHIDGSFPSRSTTREEYTKATTEVSEAQLFTLMEHVAFPQSRKALESLLGEPFEEQGNYTYWKIAGGSSEIAVVFIDDVAYSYQFGY